MKQEKENDEYSYENFLKLSEKSQAEIYFGVAQVLFKQGKTLLAIEFMTHALSIDPKLGKWLIGGSDDWD